MELMEENFMHEENHVGNILQPGEEFPPYIVELYKQLLKPTLEESHFLREIKTLINELQLDFNEESTFFKELWKKRKQELETLIVAVDIADISHEDLPLLLICRSIASQSDDKLYLKVFRWNSLPNKIKLVIDKFFSNDKLIINLTPLQDDRRKAHIQLVVSYHLVYQKMLNLLKLYQNANSKDNDTSYSAEYYLKLSAFKDQVINDLKNEKEQLEKERVELIKISRRQVVITDIYLRQNQKLGKKLNELSRKFETVMLEGKKRYDENKLLKNKLERLMIENVCLRSGSQATTSQLSELEVSNKKLVKKISELEEENIRLKCELSSLSSHLSSKSKELNSLKLGLSDKRNFMSNYESDIEKFALAADMNNRDLNQLSITVLSMMENMGIDVKNLNNDKNVKKIPSF